MKSILVAACAALIVAGCGGSDGLTRKQIGKKAGAICARYAKQGSSLGSPNLRDAKQAEQYFTRAEALTRKQQAELEKLEPAKSVKADYKKLTDTTGEITDLFGDLAKASKANDSKKLVALIQKLTPLSTQVSTTAGAVGAGGCAG